MWCYLYKINIVFSQLYHCLYCNVMSAVGRKYKEVGMSSYVWQAGAPVWRTRF